MQDLLESIERYGALLVFINVLVQQLGVPVPALPTMVMAGGLSADGELSANKVMLSAIAASLLADTVWFAAGLRFGYPVLKTLCRVSLSPDSCVRRSEDRFARWGIWALVVGKFVPGLSTVAPPIAGVMGMRPAVFAAASCASAALYFGSALVIGIFFHAQIEAVLQLIERHLATAAVVLGTLLAAYVAWKWWQRQRFLRELRLARVSVGEVADMFQRGIEPLILDVRSAAVRAREPGIKGAQPMDIERVDAASATVPRGVEVIVYCSCPNEASAARVAQRLKELGFQRVRPLAGGLDAWIAAGLPLASPTTPPAR
jgi:membrane protein DedA with SNARE-associated domain/rhodanese-related sulfurtransferase